MEPYGLNDRPANGLREGNMVDWARAQVDNPQMDFKQWGFWLREVRLARCLNERHIAESRLLL